MAVPLSSDASPHLRDRLEGVAQLVVIAVVYFLTAKGSLAFASINPSATPIWPPTGLALGLAILLGYRVLPAVFVGAFAANLSTAGDFATSAAIATGNTAEAFVATFLVVRWANGVQAFQTPAGVAKLAAAIAIGTAISATVGATALGLSGASAWASAPAVWITWWLGDLAGAAMVAPVIVLWASENRQPSGLSTRETTVLFASALVAGAVSLGPLIPTGPGRDGLAFIAIVPLMWAALRAGPRNTSTVALILSVFAVWGVAAGGGPFLQPTLNASFLLVVSFIVSVTLPSLALSAAITSRDRALAEHNLAVRAGQIGIWDWNLLTNEMDYSGQAKQIFGFPAGLPVTFEQVRNATHPDDLPNTSAMARRARDPTLREMKPYRYRIVRPDGAVRWVLASGQVVFAGDIPIRYLGTIQDTTEQTLLTRALEESNARLGLAMSAGRMAVWEYRAADMTVVASPEFNDLLAFPPGQQTTMADFRSRCADGEFNRFRRLVFAAIKRGDSLIDTEVRLALPGGRVAWLLLRAEFLRSAQRKIPDCLGVAIDITAKKLSEEHLLLLVAELNHRVKNSLAIVQSISAQTYRSVKDPIEAQQRFAARLQALARAHDVLTERNWRDADLAQLIGATVAPHLGQVGQRLRISGPSVLLRPQGALGISMILHELATNALKYGAWSNERGWVELDWTTESAKRLDLTWRERSGPTVEPPQHDGFGLKMMERSLQGFGGVSEVTFEPEGLRFSLRLSLTGSSAI
jgi:PAS domain S-box-containing protein